MLASLGKVSLNRRVSEKSTLTIAPLASVVVYPPADLIANMRSATGDLFSVATCSSAMATAVVGLATEACLIEDDPADDDLAGGRSAGASGAAGAGGVAEDSGVEVELVGGTGDCSDSIVCSSCWIFLSISFNFFFMISGS